MRGFPNFLHRKSEPWPSRKRKQAPQTQRPGDDEDPPLTPAQRRALERHVKDVEDRTRYLLVSATLPGISLYYMVQDDSWSFDDPTAATLFKRRPAARAIQALLRPGVYVVPCQVDDRGRLVLKFDCRPQGRQGPARRAAFVEEEEAGGSPLEPVDRLADQAQATLDFFLASVVDDEHDIVRIDDGLVAREDTREFGLRPQFALLEQ